MQNYAIEYACLEPVRGSVELPADDKDQAEFEVLNYIHDTIPGATEIDIISIQEVL